MNVTFSNEHVRFRIIFRVYYNVIFTTAGNGIRMFEVSTIHFCDTNSTRDRDVL